MKKIITGKEARLKFLTAAQLLCLPVAATLGPKGKNVIISPMGMNASSTKDGVTVAGEIESEDPFINAAIKIIRQVAKKTEEDAGDGTTTATILASSLIEEISKEESGNELEIKEQLISELQVCISAIKKAAYLLKTGDENDIQKISQVAAISANNDDAIGKLFAEAYKIIGISGIVMLKESKEAETYIEPVKGMHIERGFISPYFVNADGSCQFTNPFIFVTDKNVSKQKDIEKIAAFCHTQKVPLVIIAADVTGEALGFLNMNVINNQLKVCAFTIPNWQRNHKEILKDIAIYTGSKYCSEDNGFNLDNIELKNIQEILGESQQISCKEKSTIIIGGGGDQKEISKRIELLNSQITADTDDWNKEHLKMRISKLSGGIAILHAGGVVEADRKETMDRCEDAILAVRSAIEEGYLPGGGKIYYDLSNLIGNSILNRALKSIVIQLCKNSGIDYDSDLIIKMDKSEINFGLNAKTNVFEDLCAAGVVDSAKVLRVAIENAVSIALIYLSTEVIVAEV